MEAVILNCLKKKDENRDHKLDLAELQRKNLFIVMKLDICEKDRIKKFGKNYSFHVDSINGLNNYSDSLLTHIASHDNKTHSWTSTLNGNPLNNPLVSKIIKQNSKDKTMKSSNESDCPFLHQTKQFERNPMLIINTNNNIKIDNKINKINEATKKYNQTIVANAIDSQETSKYCTSDVITYELGLANINNTNVYNTNKNDLNTNNYNIGHNSGYNIKRRMDEAQLPYNKISRLENIIGDSEFNEFNHGNETNFRNFNDNKIRSWSFNENEKEDKLNGNNKKSNQSSKWNGGYNDEEEEDETTHIYNSRKKENYKVFKTAKEKLTLDSMSKNKKNQQSNFNNNSDLYSNNTNNDNICESNGRNKRSLGSRRGVGCKFITPVMNRQSETINSKSCNDVVCQDSRLKNIDPKMVEVISNEIIDNGPPVNWDDIAGLEFAKKTIKEIVVWPMLRPDIFTGLRGPPKGLLLFGPPGTGKTLIGKCIASQSKSTFFSISASTLTSKWVGDGEKMVRALFEVARIHEPSVIFIDEIDSLLSQRSDHEHESSRRIKTEFLVQLDGATTAENERLLVVGATNRPQEIDEAARRRFVKRLYIPLPELAARKQIIKHLLLKQNQCLADQEIDNISTKTEGYSGADMANLCREAALGPIRRLDVCDIQIITLDQVQPISGNDFLEALHQVKASVSNKDLDLYIEWNSKFGSWGL